MIYTYTSLAIYACEVTGKVHPGRNYSPIPPSHKKTGKGGKMVGKGRTQVVFPAYALFRLVINKMSIGMGNSIVVSNFFLSSVRVQEMW